MNVIDESWEAAKKESLSENQLRHILGFKKSLAAMKSRGKLAGLLLGKGVVLDGRSILAKEINFEQKEMNKLEGRIISYATSPRTAVTHLQILKKIVLELNKRGASIPHPRRRFVHKFPANPFSPLTVVSRSDVKRYVDVEAEWIKRTSPDPPLELVIFSAMLHSGLLSDSAIVAFVEALLDPDRSLRVLPLRVCVELNLTWRGKKNMEYRLLELDDQTAALLRPPSSYSKVEDLLGMKVADAKETLPDAEVLKRKIFATILQALRSDPEIGTPAGLRELLSIISGAARAEIPGVVVDYATQSLVAHSLKPKSAASIYGTEARFSKRAAIEDGPPDTSLADKYEVAMKTDEPPPSGLLELRKALRTDDEAQMLDRLQRIDSELPPYSAWLVTQNRGEGVPSVQFSIWKLLVQFAIHLLKPKNLGGKSGKEPLDAPTTESEVLRVARTLGRAIDKDVRRLSPGALETLYPQLLEDAVETCQSRVRDGEAPNAEDWVDPREMANRVRKYRNALANSLRKFQYFLEMKASEASEATGLPVSSGAFAKLLMSEAGLEPVSAHVLTLEGFFEARQIINGPELCQCYPMYLLEYVDAMLILGFRLGLRKGEALGLEAGDVSPNWVLVHPSDERGLKTPNSKRKLPLYPLLPRSEYCEHCGTQAELDLLGDRLLRSAVYCKQCGLKAELDSILDLRKRAQDLLTADEKFLFHNPSKNKVTTRFEIVSENLLLKVLGHAIRKASGNSQLHFHHLRHSFASWTFLRLMVAELDVVPELFPQLKETREWLNAGRQFRRDLYLDDGPTRKHTRAVSSLLGHAGPVITTEAYVHFFDRLLLPFLAESSILRIDDAAKVGVAAGLRPDEVSRMRPRSEEYKVDYRRQRGWGGHIETGIVPEVVRERFPFLRTTASPVVEAAARPVPEWQRAARFLHRYALRRDGETLDSIARMCGLEADRANQLLGNWRIISAAREADPPGNLRHPRHKAFNYGQRKKVEIECPRMPSHKAGRKLVEVIAKSIAELALANRRECHDFLLYYIDNVWGTRDWVTFEGFKSADLVQNWRKFLKLVLNPLGKKKSIHYHFFGSYIPEFRNGWKHELRLHDRYKPSHSEDWYTKPISSRIGLQPSAARYDQRITGAVALRFALTISAITELKADELGER